MKKIVNILLLIIWLSLIFVLSNQDEDKTKQTSGRFDFIINIIIKDESKKDDARFVLRKIGHFSEYLILSLLIINVIKDYKELNYKYLLLVLILCILYASSDEWHQSYVPGRVASIYDVLIDTSGALIGIFIYKIYKHFRYKKIG